MIADGWRPASYDKCHEWSCCQERYTLKSTSKGSLDIELDVRARESVADGDLAEELVWVFSLQLSDS
jgi:hypothetical protein